jgi:Zn-dependent peptidase ImmA (M78 family)
MNPYGLTLAGQNRRPYSDILIGLIESYNGKVYANNKVELLPESETGNCIWQEEEIIVIYDDTQPVDKIYFTVAHELGHIVLNHKQRIFDDKMRISKAVFELEADTFAYGFLNLLPKLHGVIKQN